MAPPAEAGGKRRGRGGAGARLSDVRWGMIFKLGWKVLGFFKVLAVSYCLMMLVQNCVNLGMAQLIGEVTKSLNAVANPAPPEDPDARAANTQANTPAASNAPAANPPSDVAPTPAEAKSRLLWVSLFWAICALAALGLDETRSGALE
jgi:hypothetical protein